MKRCSNFLFTLSLVLVAGACTSAPPPPHVPAPPDTTASAPPPPKRPGLVNVNVVCGDSSHATIVAIAPWTARPTARRAVTWALHGPGPDSMEVYAVQPNQWPFSTQVFGTAGRSMTEMVDSTAKAGTYHYGVRLFCASRTITIDPEIMVTE